MQSKFELNAQKYRRIYEEEFLWEVLAVNVSLRDFHAAADVRR